MFVIYLPELQKYAKFRSYATVGLFDDPYKASLYSRLSDAEMRKDGVKYINRMPYQGPYQGPCVIRQIKFTYEIISEQ